MIEKLGWFPAFCILNVKVFGSYNYLFYICNIKTVIMLKQIKNFLSGFSRKATKSLPKEGSVYTHNKKGNAYNGMTGVVHHHDCGTRFMIDTGNGWLCNIKP